MSDSRKEDLALVRTDLANERTLLAYGRTALMVGGTGVSLIEFLQVSPFMRVLGWVFVGAAVVIGILGFVRFARLRGRLHRD